jgi:chromosomal replication initiation ATPase DnaA
MKLLKDLISIPERVHQGDFVLQLSKGVTEPEQTLRDYVVTPQLVDAFTNALGFIQQAVQTGGSKAAYLHGSFGSGKSHFMAATPKRARYLSWRVSWPTIAGRMAVSSCSFRIT